MVDDYGRGRGSGRRGMGWDEDSGHSSTREGGDLEHFKMV